jgi:hypothetical protein
MKTYAYLWYLTEFFSEREMFQTKVVEKIKTNLILYNFFFRKSCRPSTVKKHGTARQAKDENNKKKAHALCTPDFIVLRHHAYKSNLA